MKTKPNAVDQAIRERLRLSDEQFAFYMKNREIIQDLLRERKTTLTCDEELKTIIAEEIQSMIGGKKRNSLKVMKCQMFLHISNDELEPMSNVQISKLAGVSEQAIGQNIKSGIRKLRQHPLLRQGGELHDYFLKEDEAWLR